MQILGAIIIIIGGLIMLIGSIMFLIAAFRESILWGLGCLLLWPASLIFLILHWSDAKKPFLVYLGGTAVLIVGAIVGAAGGLFQNVHH